MKLERRDLLRVRPVLVAAVVGLVLALGLFAGAETAHAQGQTGDYCVDHFQPGSNCTANDVTIGFLVVFDVTDPCDYVGDTATVYMQAEMVAGAQTRYDIGIFIALDGGDAQTGHDCYHTFVDPISTDGHCSASDTPCSKDSECPAGQTCVKGYEPGWPPVPPDDPGHGTGPFWDAETEDTPDICADLEQGVYNYYDLEPMVIYCADDDGDRVVDDISSCVSWDNTKNNDCTGVGDAFPNTKAKCRCEPIPINLFIRDVDLAVLKTGPAGDQQPGSTFEYTLEITNNGSDPSTGFRLTDDLDPLLKFVSATPNICTADPEDYGGVVTCVYNGTLDPGDSTTIVMTVQLHPDTPVDASIPNTACVQGFEYDPIEANDCDDEMVTTPVTLAYFGSSSDAGVTRFEWSTATEAGNAGFNLYGQTESGLQQINERLIPSHVVDSIEPQDYSFQAPGLVGDVFYLEEVSVRTRTQRYGPFKLGETYGAPVRVEPIDWATIRTEHESKAALQAEQRTAALQVHPKIDLLVDHDGLYRVTYEDLLAAGFDLAGVKAPALAVTSQGVSIPLRVASGRFFGPGAYIEFYGKAVDTLYTDTNVYTLQVDRSLASRVSLDKTMPVRVPPVPFYMETATVDQNREYSFLSPNGDPWYDTLMMVFTSPETWSYDIDVTNYVPSGGAPSLSVGVWGLSEWRVSPDHHVIAAFNGEPVAEEFFDGLGDHPISVGLPAGLLQQGANTLQITLPGDTGANWDMVVLDRYSVTYPRAFVAEDGVLSFTAAGDVFRVSGLPSRDVVVYRVDSDGVAQLGRVSVGGSGGAYLAVFAGSAEPATYLVSTVEALLAPGIRAARPDTDITSGTAQYLVISHPSFLDGLAPLVAAREAQGLDVRVVDVDDVYTQFGYAIFGADAIRDYVAYAAGNMATEYVLLVGGDTYDYFDYLGAGSMSFIPSLYAATDFYASWAPVDPLYADVDGDGVPDVAIGRFPVRTGAELDLMIQKTLGYQYKTYGQTGVFAADDGFTADSEAFIGQLPDGWTVERAHVGPSGVVAARATLIDAINGGVALTSFVGHSATAVWTFKGLFSADDAAALTNYGKSTVVSQWGCWNTYYVAPSYNTMAHKFMLSGDQGAAAVLGSTTISYDSSERALGRLLTPRLVEPGMSIGAALQAAKAELAESQPDLADVLLGWTILGDPGLVIQP